MTGRFTMDEKRSRRVPGSLLLLCAFMAGFSSLSGAAFAVDLLPDLIAWASQPQNYIYGGSFDLNTIDNKVLYRFNLPIPNIGDGPLELREVTHPNSTQDIYQRIYDDSSQVSEVLVGTFTDVDPPYGHMYLKGIAHYNLRTVLPENGVGPIVSTHEKISYALVDGPAYNTSLPGAPPAPVYDSVNDPLLGVSVGWADIYRSNLPGQWVEVTGVPDGQYWLEVVIDPFNRIREKDETNNTTRILVNLTIPDPQIWPGDYNGNDIVDAADFVVWRNTLGQNVPAGSGADGDGNGTIAVADFGVWQARFGETPAGAGANAGSPRGAVVPEPTSVALALSVMLALWRSRRPSLTTISAAGRRTYRGSPSLRARVRCWRGNAC